ncbi:MAG: glycosyltransferase, partial [Kiritimatiellae bacterium]|nr:glycosyltransferase [Kiritimatiellia bacterium]
MNIVHVVADYSPASEGVRRVISTLAQGLCERGHSVRILCTGQASPTLPGITVSAFPRRFPRQAYFSPSFMREIGTLMKGIDLVHIHSDWTFPVWWAAWSAKRAGIPYVHSSHGCLDPIKLRHSQCRKRLVSPLDRWVLRNASVLHAASEMEASWIAAWVPECKERIRVIPHSVEIPSTRRNFDSRESTDRPRRFLSMGRLHPLKGLDLWLQALSSVEGRWECVIAGPDEQHTLLELQSLCHKLGIVDRIRFLPFVGEEEKQQLMKEADVFVLPSRTENFGLAAGEAMAFGLPVLVTSATPWG